MPNSIIRWHDAVNLLYEMGAKCMIEMPPGNVLSKLAQQAFPLVQTRSEERR